MGPGVERAGTCANCVGNDDSQLNPNGDAQDLAIDHSPYQAHSLSFCYD
jgi:hypothetical protein